FLPRESSVYFRFSLTSRRGLLQLSAGQWGRIIGSFTPLTIVFFDFLFKWAFFMLLAKKTIQSG
ncbi:hypothetical protein, partial [Xenorhabdus littoralis]|uniref:hypothetical protein n=1 Tax=Xenorhabdus littoralis TaxID=2582835 RepID=UPI0029E82218